MQLILIALAVRFLIAYIVDKRAAKKLKNTDVKKPAVMHPAAFDLR